MCRRVCHGRMWRAVLAATALLSMRFPAAALAGRIEIVNDSVFPDAVSRQTVFSITFNRAPDFFHADSFGRADDAFQYFYDSQPEAEPDGVFSGDSVVIIRGPEIRFDHAIPVRDSLNPDNADFPNAEGWGAMRGQPVDFSLTGPTIRFTVPWKDLGETDGKFSYHLIALDRGDLTTSVAATVIPLPPGVSGGFAGLAGAGWVLWCCSRARRALAAARAPTTIRSARAFRFGSS
jgi:hypothetical protein